jgi:dipeptide/tripeptide permease
MATETFETTQIFFLDNLGVDNSLSDGIKFAQDRVYMVLLLLCAKLGDNGLGRYDTIVTGAVVYLCGTLMVSLATHPWLTRVVWYFLGIFVVLPFGEAAITANLLNFGADQFNLNLRSHHEPQRDFFWWYGAAICAGEMCALLLLQAFKLATTDAQYVANLVWTEAKVSASPASYWAIFIITSGVVFAAIALFRWTKGQYSEKSRLQLPGSAIVAVTQFLVSITADEKSVQGCMILAAKIVGVTVYVAQAALFWCPALSAPLSVCSAVGVAFSAGGIIFFCQNPSWLDSVRQPAGQALTVGEVKAFLRALPLLVCTELAYGCLNAMMETWYSRQACQMDLRFTWADSVDSPQMFVGFFQMVYCLVVVVSTPWLLWFGMPRIQRVCQQLGLRHRDWTNFLVGLAFGVASALFAAHFEICRKSSEALNVDSHCAPFGATVRSMSAFWMLVPYTLMGISTLLAVPTIMMISYRQVPRTMRSITAVTFIFMTSASRSVVSAISLAMVEYTPHDLDSGNLEYLYFVGIAVSLGMLGVFSYVVQGFQERNFEDTVVRTNDSDDDCLHMAPAA